MSTQTIFLSQVVKHLPKAHILACTPSNSGADLLCQRLRVHLPSSIYRLLAPSRDIRMVPEDIKVCKEGQGMVDVWEVLRALENLLCDFGWVRTPLGTSVAKGGEAGK